MSDANKRRDGSRSRRIRVERLPLGQRGRPTAERIRRAAGHYTRGDTGQITMRDSPLERALARRVVTPEQYAAGQKYRHHWYHAGLCDPLA